MKFFWIFQVFLNYLRAFLTSNFINNFDIIFFKDKTSSELLFKGYCFEELNFYELELTFKHDLTDLILPTHNSLLNTPSILIDSVKPYFFLFFLI